ncbi:hypothetical protein ABEB36_013494 [Hypothenemus hampei]|uniref:Uncharacterized protein n=1 Tax=Hypothenemus hampei TaxID=57062 RepID=A0ABD1E4N7_HYPHA
MDSNDRDIMTKYIENLKSDQKDIRISLSKEQTVIKEMGTNICKTTPVKLTRTFIQRIDTNKIVINPKDRTTVYSSCIDDGLTAISNPTIIKIQNCELKMDGRKFIPSQNKSTGIIFNLPNFVSFNVSEVNSQKTLQIPSMKHEDLKNIKVLTENMEAPIPEYFTITNIQGISMSLIGIVAVIAIGVSIIVWKFRQHQRFKTTRQSRNQESRNKCQDFNLESIPKQEPLFCHLREGGII